LFAAFLGYNPLKMLLGPKVLAHLGAGQAKLITSRAFFPQLIGPPFKHALMLILVFAVVMSVIAALASAMRGGKYIHEDEESRAQKARVTHHHLVRHHAVEGDGDGVAVEQVPTRA
ncbi:MAG: hypothetical protein WAL35_07195, partial [Acidimicrobiales bacterium]